ncbi:lipase family protein [Cupriavidus metallidurans]|uniref:lipase family protein n=1 Tax=Cupriavidus metallidurans TaxID=119219 RepID=UPI001CCB9F85|nr:lipase family protein [Cupriavidus metallidurans]UBM09376.1 lipase family protein [Cupriavidus metallidurans]
MPMVPDSEVFLLQACESAYAVETNGDLQLPLSDVKTIGLINTVQGFATGSRYIDAAFVGTVPNGVLLAFRGTLPPGHHNAENEHHAKQIASDWLHDCEAALVIGDKLPGRVHQGFLGALDALWPSIWAAVAKRLAPATRLYICGHSKGGAVAHLAAARFALSTIVHGSDITVRTFEGAHSGDQAFVQGYRRMVSDVTRYECRDDLIPHLPPSLMFRHLFQEADFFKSLMAIDNRVDYAPAGDLKFLDWNNTIQEQTVILSTERLAHMAKAIAGDFKAIVASHSLANWFADPVQ